MKSILYRILIILIFANLFYDNKSAFGDEIQTDFYYAYYYYNAETPYVDPKAFNSDTFFSEFRYALKWKDYNKIYITFDDDFYESFPEDDMNWNEYCNVAMPSAIDSWKDAVSLNVYTGDRDYTKSVYIGFWDGWSAEFSRMAGYTYRAFDYDEVEDRYYLQYESDTSPDLLEPYTRIILNSSQALYDETEPDPGTGFLTNVKWTLSTPPQFNEIHFGSIIKHELGHVFGLAHPGSDPDWSTSIMGSYHVGNVWDVTNMDRLAVKYLINEYIPPPGQGINEITANDISIEANFPNPFNSETIINYTLHENTQLSIRVYNALGQNVCILFNGAKQKGRHQIEWDGRNDIAENVSSGIYFISIHSHKYNALKKILLMR
ncbi:zinc-dependent metalloprotease [candidate division KSB1 bacterium]|nr:zinc-dependent metalloprotease [candidate division KSB1 bacterium]